LQSAGGLIGVVPQLIHQVDAGARVRFEGGAQGHAASIRTERTGSDSRARNAFSKDALFL